MNTTIQSSENLNFGGRFLRLALGATLLLPVFTLSGPIGGWAVLALIAVFPIISGIYGYCPAVSWMRNLMQKKDAQLSQEQRIEYGLLAAVLIASVFVADTSASGGVWLLLPLLGIYPMALAIFGEKLLSAVIASSHSSIEQTSTRTSAKIMKLTQNASSQERHVSIEHAA